MGEVGGEGGNVGDYGGVWHFLGDVGGGVVVGLGVGKFGGRAQIIWDERRRRERESFTIILYPIRRFWMHF